MPAENAIGALQASSFLGNKAMFQNPKGLTELDVGDVSSRFALLGLKRPTGICILPNNYLYAEKTDDLFLAVSAPDIKVRLRQAGVPPETIIPDGVKIPYRDDRDSTLVLPTLFVAACYLSQNPDVLNVALGVVANYVTDFFKGRSGANRVKCSVHVETTDKKTVKNIEYDGDPEQFAKIVEAIKRAIR